MASLSNEANSTPAPAPVHPADGGIRMAVWAGLLLGSINLFSAGGTVSVREYFIPFTAFLLLMAGYVLCSVNSVAQALRRAANAQPVLLALAPLVLLLPYGLVARQQPDFDPANLLATAMLVFLPVSCALLNTPSLKREDVLMGLVTVALPLVGPLLRNEALTQSDLLLRGGALALPVLLLLFTNKQQKQQLNFLFICAVLSLWFSVEFAAFPEYSLPNTPDLNYFNLAVLPLFLYVLALAGRFGALGLAFKPSARGAGALLLHLVLVAAMVVPIGLLSRSLIFESKVVLPFSAAQLPDGLTRLFTLFLFVALPEEILFRGALLTYFKDALGWPDWGAVGLSSLLFGLAHLNNPPDNGASVGWVVLLATLAGLVYGRVFLRSRNVTAGAALHAVVNGLWGLLFR